MEEQLRAYAVTYDGITVIIAAPTRGKAAYKALLDIRDYGDRRATFAQLRSRRAARYDGWAATAREGDYIPAELRTKEQAK